MNTVKRLIPETDPLLTTKLDPFVWYDDHPEKAKEIHEQLIDTMYEFNGVGLACNQIGHPYRVFAMIHEGEPMTIFNPRITDISEDLVKMEEGCLTYPGLFVKIERPKSISVQFANYEGQIMQAYFSDLSARIFQHEFDHINGEVFFDLASNTDMNQGRRERKSYLRKMKKENSKLWQNHIKNKELKKNIQKTL